MPRTERMMDGMALYRWLARHYIPTAVCLGVGMLLALAVALPILFARG